MKKFLALAVILSVTTFVGCGEATPAKKPADKPAAPTTPAADPKAGDHADPKAGDHADPVKPAEGDKK